MASLGKKLKTTGENGLMFYCPACQTSHGVKIGWNGWQWNEQPERPTFMPSLLSVAGELRCHCYVRNGVIEYLADSTHALKGQSAPMPDWPFSDNERSVV